MNAFLLIMVFVTFIGSAFTVDDEFSIAMDKVIAKYCKNTLELKEKLAILKCENILRKDPKDAIYECIKKFEDHSHETSIRPIICYLQVLHPKSQTCITDYLKVHLPMTKEEQEIRIKIGIDFRKCLVDLPVN